MRTSSRLLAAVVVAALALPGLAGELITTDGTSHQCEILSVEEDGVLARGKMKSGGVVEIKVPVARLDPHNFYALRDAAIGNDAKARLRFAVWCVENDLFAQAKTQMQKAAATDATLIEELVGGKYPEVREKIASRVLASAERDLEANRFDPAREKLEILLGRLPDTEGGAKACDVLRALESKSAEAETKREADARAKLDEIARKASETRAKLLAAVDEDNAKGRTLAVDGLTEDSVGKALDLLAKALTHREAAMKKLDAIEKAHATDAELLAEAKERRRQTIAAMVKVRIHRADLYIWRSSLPNAKEEIDAARTLDPSSPEIDAAMQRLLAADADDPLELRWLRERRAGGSRFGRGARGR